MMHSSPRDLLADALGNDPFPYQAALLDRFVVGDLPRQLDVPTGLGKTAVIAIWLVARALGAPVPRRLIYVVDRRAVVDQATGEAERLRTWVASKPEVARQLGLDGELPISTLRGQHVDNRAWLADPSSPAIVVGTVDMIGSRLLFSGYGVSRRMRPYHAGLLGADTLVVLDEAHLVPPFARLMATIADGRDHAFSGPSVTAGVVPPFRTLSLSATSREQSTAHRLDAADYEHLEVARRLDAVKRLSLHDQVDEKSLPATLADHAWRLAQASPSPSRIVVFVDRRRDAQAVSEALRSREPAADVELLVGARRVHERAELARWLERHGFVAGKSTPLERHAFLVATAAGEVGIDIDADHMVADVVAWERTVQRLGRVNRRGNGDARVELYPCPTEATGERVEATLSLLRQLPRNDDDTHDASPGALLGLRDTVGPDAIAQASTPAPLFPPLQRAHVESWSMTSLDRHAGRPEVAPWLRGWVDDEPQSTVVFRRHLPITDDGASLPRKLVTTYLDAAPVQLAERLEIETRQLLAWLDARRKALLKAKPASGDATNSDGGPSKRPRRLLEPNGLVGMVLDGAGEFEAWLSWTVIADVDQRKRLESQLAERTIVIDAAVGGLEAGLLDPGCDTAADVGELTIDGKAAVPIRVVRVALSNAPDTKEIGAEPTLGASSSTSAPSTGSTVHWRTELRLPITWNPAGEATEALVVESTTTTPAQSEDARSFTPRHAQLLDEHEDWAETCARTLAKRLGLPTQISEVLALAARLHDEGKRAPHWQQAFGVSNADLRAGRHYGKTTHRPDLFILSDYRHEFGSLPRAAADPRVRALPDDLRDLLLHLIAAHHGHARPILPIDGAEEPPTVAARRQRDVALRFARLEQQWGPWGLAWLEALLRAADQQASRRNDERGNG